MPSGQTQVFGAGPGRIGGGQMQEFGVGPGIMGGGHSLRMGTHSLPSSCMPSGQTQVFAVGPGSIGGGQTQMPAALATCGGGHNRTGRQTKVLFTVTVVVAAVIVTGEGGA